MESISSVTLGDRELDAHIAEATGKVVITLDNGQVWSQVDRSSLRLSTHDKVSIRRASLGSFMLYKAGRKTPMRVKRVS